MYYGDNNKWECNKPTFAKVRIPCDKVMQDNAHGVVVVEEEDNLLKRKFCLETGGTFKKSNDTKGLNNAFSSYTFYNRWIFTKDKYYFNDFIKFN